MPQKRGTLTDHINNVLQVLELGRKSGHLYVERGEDEQTEKGELVFHAGRIVGAHCGPHQGMTALSWLQQWGPCRFIFENNNAEQTTGNQQEYSPRTTNAYTPYATGTQHNLPLNRQTASDSELQQTSPLPVFSTPSPFQATPLHNPSLTTRPQTGINPALDYGQRVPQRTCPADEGLAILAQSRLSRLHRQCYLLIDGQHCISELIRLLGRNVLEVQQIVQDLAAIGIIKY